MSHYEVVSKEELKKLSHKDQVRFALFCAKYVSHLNSNHKVQLSINTVELWLDNKATAEECRAAGYAAGYAADAAAAAAGYAAGAAAGYAAGYAAADAGYAAADAGYAAAHAGYAAADAHAAAAAAYAHAAAAAAYAADLRRQQREYYNGLLYIDENFEKIVLDYK